MNPTKTHTHQEVLQELRNGGEWLKAAREWVQSNVKDCDGLPWSSGQLVSLPFYKFEELALAFAVAAVIEDRKSRAGKVVKTPASSPAPTSSQKLSFAERLRSAPMTRRIDNAAVACVVKSPLLEDQCENCAYLMGRDNGTAYPCRSDECPAVRLDAARLHSYFVALFEDGKFENPTELALVPKTED